ncbi:hypothetical protein M9Y10_001158 [Tritrichomonas musculus]|uniref:Uncharacterized protein n=1 Tax=Tritrichomonas musculus TaxID=1915356 RepID=A0ABR2L7A0_9EUKA
MSEKDDIRKESRIPSFDKINQDSLSPDEYHQFANDFFNIPKDQLQPLLHRLQKNYIPCITINNQEDEILIIENIVSILSLEMPDDFFVLYCNILYLIINASFRNSDKYKKLFKKYLSLFLQFLLSDNLMKISSTLLIISMLTSLSKSLCIATFRIIPTNLFYDFIIRSIDIENVDIMSRSAHIVRNMFYVVEIKKIDDEIIEKLFKCVSILCESNKILIIPDIIKCVRDIIAKKPDFCSIIVNYKLIPYFNSYLLYNNEDVQSYVLLIFQQLIVNKIGQEDIDFFVIFQMIPEANKKISFPAIQIFSTFLQKFPDNTDIYFQLGGVSQLTKIFKEGAFEVKRQALNIVFSLLSNALPENKFLLIQMPNLIESLIEMTNDVNQHLINLIFNILKMIISIADVFNYHNQIKERFMESQNIDILEDLANQEGTFADSVTQIFNSLS